MRLGKREIKKEANHLYYIIHPVNMTIENNVSDMMVINQTKTSTYGYNMNLLLRRVAPPNHLCHAHS